MGAELFVPSTQCPTIQAGIDAAQDGDTVIVRDGTYTGVGNRDLSSKGKAITVRSEHGPEVCIIDCQGTQSEPHWGFYFSSSSYPAPDCVVDGLTITNGYAKHEGGGMEIVDTHVRVTNCTFSGNSAGYGGGLEVNSGAVATVTNCTFIGNSSDHGGGMSVDSGAGATVTNCTFSGNSGDGIEISDVGGATVTNCTFSGNSDDGIDMTSARATVTNCTFIGNADHGIDMTSARATVTNCTFSGNSGGGMHIFWPSSVATVTNCIFWSDLGDEVWVSEADVTVTYSDIQGGFPGEGNIDADPLLDSTLHLQAGSPCIDAGNSAAVPGDVTTDLDDNARIQGTSVDMGAYESPFTSKPVLVGINITPRILYLNSSTQWITCWISSPGRDAADIDVASIRLEDSLEVHQSSLIRLFNALVVKFDQSEVEPMLEPGENELTVTGEFNGGVKFEGSGTIWVRDLGQSPWFFGLSLR